MSLQLWHMDDGWESDNGLYVLAADHEAEVERIALLMWKAGYNYGLNGTLNGES